jgi:hypothetical protein
MAPIFKRTINAISGRRASLSGGFGLRDTVVGFRPEGIPAIQVFDPETKPGSYELAWCANALEKKCPAEPRRVTVKWFGKSDSAEVLLPIQGLEPGLNRLVTVGSKQGEWFYTNIDAWVLMVRPERLKDIEARYSALAAELAGFPKEDQSRTRTLMVAFLATQTK